ncbi:hypothetical protein [Funiculus sociatus]|uniref:hypothetical protein n=1 Tax=Funiculus sociatus TaxID=450527 RepID=UPI003296FF83
MDSQQQLKLDELETSVDTVKNDELLYRCIFYGRNCYQVTGNTAKISSQAFSDRHQAPSMDRACLCNYDPKWTQKHEQNGVISLIVVDIRMIDSVVQCDAKGNIICQHKIDVHPRPTTDNIAHAQIEPSPEYQNKTTFRKLLERLAFLANQREWEIKPYDLC